MQGEDTSTNKPQSIKGNRPHCFYLWFLHGKAVCSEETLNRSCAYPFWECPARSVPSDPSGKVMNESASQSMAQEKIFKELGSA
ncbi:hypothetical protein [Methanospirillum lacunae]|uniref:Uncharacterized protein n=1 Tax=Methanospirillum lacunae TaxID=668570 RepID=A0A2V2N4P0_9EURY|nr:hypothetical protein DK846_07180 [Methanospirillum lacunae]